MAAPAFLILIHVETIMKITIGHLYPELLNLYGDSGNICCLQKRLEWRGIQAEICSLSAGNPIDFRHMDLILLGGSSDREQALACRYLKETKYEFKEFVENDGVVLAICGGYQLLGKYYQNQYNTVEGLNILDIYTDWESKRLVQNIVIHNPIFNSPVVGFENHGGRTHIGGYTPFGKVLASYGNTEDSGHEGVTYKNVIGTYLHGPLLPKNPEVCDYLLSQALKRKYGEPVPLSPLPDELEYRANYETANHSPLKYNGYQIRKSLFRRRSTASKRK